eukprot:g46753.t1
MRLYTVCFSTTFIRVILLSLLLITHYLTISFNPLPSELLFVDDWVQSAILSCSLSTRTARTLKINFLVFYNNLKLSLVVLDRTVRNLISQAAILAGSVSSQQSRCSRPRSLELGSSTLKVILSKRLGKPLCFAAGQTILVTFSKQSTRTRKVWTPSFGARATLRHRGREHCRDQVVINVFAPCQLVRSGNLLNTKILANSEYLLPSTTPLVSCDVRSSIVFSKSTNLRIKISTAIQICFLRLRCSYDTRSMLTLIVDFYPYSTRVAKWQMTLKGTRPPCVQVASLCGSTEVEVNPTCLVPVVLDSGL